VQRPEGNKYRFKRLTEEARAGVIRARDNAKCRNHTAIDDRHFLLALTQDEGNTAAIILMTLGYDCAEIRGVVEQLTRPTKAVGELKDLPFSRSAKEFLERSGQEAERFDFDFIGCEHFLLSLLHEEVKWTVTRRILRDFGVTYECVDRSVKELIQLLEYL
jgi:ATP-dependent Clp protease ATP-binding subunit ClpA